jgi:hypothetical protein
VALAPVVRLALPGSCEGPPAPAASNRLTPLRGNSTGAGSGNPRGFGNDTTHVAPYERAHSHVSHPGPAGEGITVSAKMANPALFAQSHHQSRTSGRDRSTMSWNDPASTGACSPPGVEPASSCRGGQGRELDCWEDVLGELDRGGVTRHDPGDAPCGSAIYGLPWVRDADDGSLP